MSRKANLCPLCGEEISTLALVSEYAGEVIHHGCIPKLVPEPSAGEMSTWRSEIIIAANLPGSPADGFARRVVVIERHSDTGDIVARILSREDRVESDAASWLSGPCWRSPFIPTEPQFLEWSRPLDALGVRATELRIVDADGIVIAGPPRARRDGDET